MNKLSAAFTAAWKDLKSGAAKVAAVLTKDGAGIQTAVADAGTVLTVIDPALAPAVTEFDQFEEEIVGKVLELATDAANAASLGAFFGTAWPAILALKSQLSVHPAVAAATSAPKS